MDAGAARGRRRSTPTAAARTPPTGIRSTHPSCAAYPPTPRTSPRRAKYTGVQDYDDYDEGPNPYFYDPDDAAGAVGATAGPRTRA